MNLDISTPTEITTILTSPTYSDHTREMVLYDYLKSQIKKFLPYLSNYRQDTARGTILDDSVELFDLEDDCMSFSNNSGIFWIKFTEDAYYGCKDMDDLHDHEYKISFIFSPSSACISIQFMDEQVRDPDDY